MAMQQMLGPIAGSSDYEIERSLRFDLGASSKLTRTPSSASNRRTWTLSFWIKRSRIGDEQMVFSAAENSGNRFHIYFPNEDYIAVYSDPPQSGVGLWYMATSAVARDPSAWMHLVFACDTTQSTATDRFKIYVNGVLATDFTNRANPDQNLETPVNSTILHQFSGRAYNTDDHFGGYLAEAHFTDGQALSASSFGEYDDDNNWIPKKYTGSYGTNGYFLKFADNSSASALGTDSSGNNNTWTVSNISAAAGIDYLGTGTYTASQWDSTNTIDRIFDGNDGTLAYRPNSAGAGTSTFTFGTTVTVTSSLQIRGWKGDSNERIFANGVDISSHFNSQSGGGLSTQNVTSTVGSTPFTLTSVGSENQNNRAGALAKIIVDGVTLINGSSGDMDSLIDTPTNYTPDSGNSGGNYATLNPLDRQASNGTLSNGNLELTQTGAAWAMYRSTMFVSSGKWYWECTLGNNQYSTPGICTDAWSMASATNAWANEDTSMYGYYPYNGNKYNGSSGVSYATADTSASGSVIGVALDMDNGTLTFYKDGTSLGTAYTGLTGKNVSPTHWLYNQTNADLYNFGQRPFAHTPPTGYKSLCTANLPDPAIADPSTAMDIALYNGNGGTQSVAGLNLAPDWVWIKNRNGGHNHMLFDIVRGAGADLQSNSTATEGSAGSNDLTSFDSSGFSLGSNNAVNQSGRTFVAWAWDAGTTTSSNTDGSITSSVRANTSAGFSIVTYTGNNTTSTVGHGLNATPSLVIVKSRSATSLTGWMTKHSSLSSNYNLALNLTAAAWGPTTNGWVGDLTSSTTFSLVNGSSDGNNVNQSGVTYVAYCFAPVAGYSAFGSYAGNGSNDGPFVYTGFRPKYILTKAYSSNSNNNNEWNIRDTSRDPYNEASEVLAASNANQTLDNSHTGIDILSNGFKLKNDTNGQSNYNGWDYIYVAFAEKPFKTARAR